MNSLSDGLKRPLPDGGIKMAEKISLVNVIGNPASTKNKISDSVSTIQSAKNTLASNILKGTSGSDSLATLAAAAGKYKIGDLINASSLEYMMIANYSSSYGFFNDAASIWFNWYQYSYMKRRNLTDGSDIYAKTNINDFYPTYVKSDGTMIGRTTSWDGTSNSAYYSHLASYDGFSSVGWATGTQANGSQNAPPSFTKFCNHRSNVFEGASYCWTVCSEVSIGAGVWITDWSGNKIVRLSNFVNYTEAAGYQSSTGYVIVCSTSGTTLTISKYNLSTGAFISSVTGNMSGSASTLYYDPVSEVILVFSASYAEKFDVNTGAKLVSTTTASIGFNGNSTYLNGIVDASSIIVNDGSTGTYYQKNTKLSKIDFSVQDTLATQNAYAVSLGLNFNSRCAYDASNQRWLGSNIGKMGSSNGIKIIS